MSTALLPYPEYKSTKTLGLHSIPENWIMLRVKYLFSIGRGRVISEEELEPEAKYPVYSSQTKNNGCLGHISTYDFDCRQITWTTDGANAGTVFIREGKHNCTNVCGTLQPLSTINLEFVHYCLQYVAQFYKRPDTNGAKIMNGEMAEIFVPYPTNNEQIKITNFLDHETAKIDTLIEKQQQLIKLLKEKRQAVISHAVTKGLNPDAPMKDSGVEWLGEVPAHWKIEKVGRACLVKNNLRTPIERQLRMDMEGVYPYYGPTGVLNYINKYAVDGDHFLIGEDGDHFLKYMTKSMTIYVDEKFSVNNHAHLIKGGPDCTTRWACLFFEHQDLSPWLIKQGVARYKLRKESLLTIPMLVPPLGEQESIVAEIECKKEIFTNLIDKVQGAVKILKERRTALISAAVTGKIYVRNWQPPESSSTSSTNA